MVHMDVIHGPRRAEPGTYDAWTRVLQTVDPRFEFTDPPLRHSLQMNLAFAATADRPTAVLTGPSVIAGSRPGLILFDTAESITSPGPARQVEPELKAMSLPATHLGQALSARAHGSDPRRHTA